MVLGILRARMAVWVCIPFPLHMAKGVWIRVKLVGYGTKGYKPGQG